MSKPNRYDVTRALGGLSGGTTTDVAHQLQLDATSSQLEKALENAHKHGLIDASRPAADGAQVTWRISEKGRRKVTSQS